jgi:hypothetical protein
MSNDGTSRPRGIPTPAHLARRAAAATFAPVADAAVGALDDQHVLDALDRIVESGAARQLIASMFETGLFDEFVDRLIASDGLWRLVDEVAASPAVAAAVTQQSLGFLDQVGDRVRARSRGADDRLEHAAQRLRRHRDEPNGAP